MDNNLIGEKEGDDDMTTYMKQTVGNNGEIYQQRPFNLLAIFRSFSRNKSHIELIDSLIETAPTQLPQDVEEKIRLFRQKHFKN
jgi:hypothetical protein